ncbi:MAG: hypothetical protein FWD78_06735 [Treponema sp.]|nr:hypothetical protein [Treponema sp.]
MNYKDGKWAKKITGLQRDDGSWGYFHSLSNPVAANRMTTEQALRRLQALGFTIDDSVIKQAVNYLDNCLTGKTKPPDRGEKNHNWKVYTELMLSAWIRIFTDKNAGANQTAAKWRAIIETSFAGGKYDHDNYIRNFENVLKIKFNPRAGRLADFVHFYIVSLLTNTLDKKIEPLFFKYILEHKTGIYYVYGKKLTDLPKIFQSKGTDNYLAAIELLANYKNPECKKQLAFIAKWLNQNRLETNKWDLGKQAKDDIHLPLSDSWRTAESRIQDCSYRIGWLLNQIKYVENQ